MLEHWAQGLQIGFPNLMVSFSFLALRPIQGHKVQHLPISSLGRIENIFSISGLTPSVKPLGMTSTFCTNRMLDLS